MCHLPIPPLTIIPPPPPSHLHPFFLHPYKTLLTNPASYPTCGCSLQRDGSTALLRASSKGHTEQVQALLAAADIDVNHANVSIYPLTPSHAVVEGEGGKGLPPLIPRPNPRTNFLSPLNLK